MFNSESVQENEAYKLFWDFEIQDTDHLISSRKPDIGIVKKKKKKKKKIKKEKKKEKIPNSGLCRSSWP